MRSLPFSPSMVTRLIWPSANVCATPFSVTVMTPAAAFLRDDDDVARAGGDDLENHLRGQESAAFERFEKRFGDGHRPRSVKLAV
jgi:hypothetical protein